MLPYLPVITGLLLAIGVVVVLVVLGLAVRTAINAKPQELSEIRVEFSEKRRIVMRWQNPAPPDPSSSPRPQLMRDSENDDAA